VVWYDILIKVNTVSKLWQTETTQLDLVTKHVEALITWLEAYRRHGFADARTTSNSLCEQLEISNELKDFRQGRKSRASEQERTADPMKAFERDYFLVIVDQALMSMKERFTKLQSHSSVFGFLYDIPALQKLRKSDILEKCTTLEACLKHASSSDVCGTSLAEELHLLSFVLKERSSVNECLVYLLQSQLRSSYPNTCIALRILLTIPLSVASAERSFSKLKLIKTYLRSTMKQERLS
ncbi:unnamed protein product, partial [Ixodes pacificus]